MDLTGKAAIVTGASSGIGRATALELARMGARIALVARRADALEKVASEVRGAGGEPHVITCDVRDTGQVHDAATQAIDTLGRIDILVNNAGYGLYLPAQDTSLEKVQDLVETNYTGTVRFTLELLPHMIENRAGHIINVASAAAFVTVPSFTAYSAAKSAVLSYSEGLYHDLKPHGIHVSVVNPGPARTAFVEEKTFSSMPAIGPLMTTPERVARVVISCLRWRWFCRTTPWWLAVLVRMRNAFPEISRWLLGLVARPRG